MNHFLTRANKAVSFVLTSLIAVQAFAYQYFSSEDQATIQQWINQADFTTYSAVNQKPSLHDLPPDTLFTLQALHESRPEQFYRYLARLIIRSQLSDSELTHLLKSKFDLNTTQNHVFETFIIEKNEIDLGDWLNRYMEMKRLLGRDERFYSDLFQLLTTEVTSSIQNCSEISMLEHINGIKEKRRAILQCIVQAVNVNIADIDISPNRVTSSRIFGPQPISPDKFLPSPTTMEDSEHHFTEILDVFNDPQIKPVILLTSPLEKGFIAPLVKKTRHTSQKIGSPPSIKNTRANKINKSTPKRNVPRKSKKGNHTTFLKSEPPYWPVSWIEPWIKSPGYSIAAWTVAGIAVTLFVAYFPYPANPFL
ncbi:hypothetical protein [Endozoicomonas sp.]|uniref:hypothetical protein n=1 Tax=Endozoicomonas sp. TaxID=1892382 RepID=UPI0028854220|nr:hypothetical protein [Endozoicomonas sp.]